MPTATEPAAPKAAAGAAKPKPAPKKPAEGGAKKPAEGGAKKPAADSKKPAAAAAPAAEKKQQPTAAGAEKKPAAAGDKKKPAAAPATGDKKQQQQPTAAVDKKAAPAPKRVVQEVDDDDYEPAPVYVPKLPVTLAVLNSLEWPSCAKVLQDLLNLTPSVGAALAALRPFKSAQHMVDQLHLALEALPLPYIEVFLKRFNELPLIPKAKLTKEHKCCVGLDKLSEEQKAELAPLYNEYRGKFGFPFVVCAREAKAAELPVMLRSHLLNDKDQELQSGRKEVKKIARMRLLEVVTA